MKTPVLSGASVLYAIVYGGSRPPCAALARAPHTRTPGTIVPALVIHSLLQSQATTHSGNVHFTCTLLLVTKRDGIEGVRYERETLAARTTDPCTSENIRRK